MKKSASAHITNETPTFETLNDLPREARIQLCSLLNQWLADGVDLQSHARQAHWNVKGPNFYGLHKLFEEIYDGLGEFIDELAERITQLGGVAEGTARVAASRSSLEEYPLDIADGIAHVQALSKSLSEYGREIRRGIDEADELDDADTADLLTGISRAVDKWLWMVEAHAQAPK